MTDTSKLIYDSQEVLRPAYFDRSSLARKESRRLMFMPQYFIGNYQSFTWKMTLEDGEDTKGTMNKMGIGEALRNMLLQALEQGRLTCGIFESAVILEENPDSVMLCVVPQYTTTEDISLNIHTTLIEAFCCENDIYLVKVDATEKLSKLFSSLPSSQTPVNDNEVTSTRMPFNDFSCLLVQFPTDKSTEAELNVMDFCKTSNEYAPYPVIDLPV